jgi:hypothetical protein
MLQVKATNNPADEISDSAAVFASLDLAIEHGLSLQKAD